MKPSPLFCLEHCSFSYGNQFALKDISAKLYRGNFYGIIGPNGSGKTTLLDLLLGHKATDSGSLLFKGRPLAEYSKTALSTEISLVPQEYILGFDFTVYQVVMMGRHPHIARFNSPSTQDHAIVCENLKLLDIWSYRNKPASALSGGEKQRVVVARALSQNCPVLLLDEATASLDIQHTIDIMKKLSDKVDNQGLTVIAILHDLNLAAAYCDFLLALKDGRLFSAGKTNEMLSQQLIKDLFQVSATIDNNRILYEYR